VQPSETPLSAEEVARKIKNDLQTWQEKFAKAADKGTEDLEQRVREITSRQIKNQAKGVGQALLVQFEQTANSKYAELQKLLSSTLSNLDKTVEQDAADDAFNAFNDAIREAGVVIRAKAQAIRNFKIKYDEETINLVKAASESTLEVIDNIRDLGLQEIGMRWAWMEGVTYKDWSKYHALKKTFDEWRDEVEQVAMTHEGLEAAKEAGDVVEEKAMKTAQGVATKLIKLKESAKEKIYERVTVKAKVEQKLHEAVDNAASAASSFVSSSSQGSVESVSSVAAESAASIASDLSSAVLGTSTGTLESISSAVAESAASLASDASSAVLGTSTGTLESISSLIKDTVSEAVAKSEPPIIESAASVVTSSLSSVASSASEIASEVVSKASSSLSSASSSASSKVLGGVAAQVVVEAREPVFDVEFDDSEDSVGEKIKKAAGDAEEWLVSVLSEAIIRPTSTKGVVESATSLADEHYSRAIAAASSAIYGRKKNNIESLTSIASEKYSEAVTA